MDIIVLFGVLFLCITISIPLGFSILISATVAFILFTDIPLQIIAQSCITGVDSFSMLAIPFFYHGRIDYGKRRRRKTDR